MTCLQWNPQTTKWTVWDTKRPSHLMGPKDGWNLDTFTMDAQHLEIWCPDMAQIQQRYDILMATWILHQTLHIRYNMTWCVSYFEVFRYHSFVGITIGNPRSLHATGNTSSNAFTIVTSVSLQNYVWSSNERENYVWREGEFPIIINLHQGLALNPYLFTLTTNKLTTHIQVEVPWCMLFANNIM